MWVINFLKFAKSQREKHVNFRADKLGLFSQVISRKGSLFAEFPAAAALARSFQGFHRCVSHLKFSRTNNFSEFELFSQAS